MSKRTVNYNEEFMAVPETNEENMGEHFQDPPPAGNIPIPDDDMDEDYVEMHSDRDLQASGLTPGR